jgi:Omp85 superfamily domain
MTRMRFAVVSVLLLVTAAGESRAQTPPPQTPPTEAPPAPVPSAPPSTVPAISDIPAPGAVTIPIPTLPPDESAELPNEQLRQFSRKHPKVVHTMMRINRTLPGWTLRMDTIIDGSGIAGGAAYRNMFDDNHASFDLMGMLSINTYYLVNTGVTYARPSDKRLLFTAALRHESYPKEDFYGFGRDSADVHTVYWRQSFDSIGGVTFSPRPSVHISGTAGIVDARMLTGRDGDKPSVETRFSPAEVPGVAPGQWTNYLHAGAGIDIERTDDLMFPKGWRYRGSFTRYRGIGDAVGLFSRVDIDLRQYWAVPHASNQVLAARMLIGSISSEDSAAVPFYFLPRLGGGTTLRGYDTSRLTDRDALAFNVEYRVKLGRLQLLALVDLGDVAPTFGDLRPSKSHTATGAGVRFQTGGAFLPGVDIAHGSEGWAAVVRMGHAF